LVFPLARGRPLRVYLGALQNPQVLWQAQIIAVMTDGWSSHSARERTI
jgi:hypothetical protein